MHQETRRLFFGLEAISPWPVSFPKGRIIQEQERHATLAFLGEVDWKKILPMLSEIPKPIFKAGLAGVFNKNLFLPPRHPHVVCWHVDLAESLKGVENYQKQLTKWLESAGFHLSHREPNWLPHVTLARQPFDEEAWKNSFTPLPVVLNALHLYQSMGSSHYRQLWSQSIPLPWEEIEHTADIAFIIRGESLKQIYRHALLALAFKFPSLLEHLPPSADILTLDEIIILLNDAIAQADQAIGCPFKAVAFHGDLNICNDILAWEMIVDV